MSGYNADSDWSSGNHPERLNCYDYLLNFLLVAASRLLEFGEIGMMNNNNNNLVRRALPQEAEPIRQFVVLGEAPAVNRSYRRD